jgi:hypothetical protein
MAVIVPTLALGALALLASTTSANAKTTSAELNMNIASVLSLTIDNCDNTNSTSLTLEIAPTQAGAFKAACQNVSVDTNLPGYTLFIKQHNDSPPDETYVLCQYFYGDIDLTADKPFPACVSTDVSAGVGDSIANTSILLDLLANEGVVCLDAAIFSNYDYTASSLTGNCVDFGGETPICRITMPLAEPYNCYTRNPALTYQNPTTISPKPTIPSTDKLINKAAPLANDSWGFAVADRLGFGNAASYTATNQNAKYAQLPTTDTEVYHTSTWPIPVKDFTTWYGAKLSLATTAGIYKTTIVYTTIGTEIPPVEEVACVSGHKFKGNIGDMQDFDTARLANVGDTGIATDTRDSQPYCIGKLADGNIWMLNNLRVGSDSHTTPMTSSDTNLTAASNPNITGNPGSLSFTLPQLTQSTSDSSYDDPRAYGPLTAAVTSDHRDYNSSDPTSNSFGGYLYNWSAMTAGESRLTLPGGDGSELNVAPNSICPKDWGLPILYPAQIYGNTDSDFARLNVAMYNNGSGTTSSNFYDAYHAANFIFSGPFRGVLSGSWSNSTGFGWQGSMAYLGLATAYPNDGIENDMFVAAYDTTIIITGGQGTFERKTGIAARCLLRL